MPWISENSGSLIQVINNNKEKRQTERKTDTKFIYRQKDALNLRKHNIPKPSVTEASNPPTQKAFILNYRYNHTEAPQKDLTPSLLQPPPFPMTSYF